MADEVIYNDPTANNFPDDYKKGNVDSRSAIRTKAIREKMYGKDVREAIAQGVEISSVVSSEASATAKAASTLSNNIKQQFYTQINGQDKDDEAKDARVSASAGKTYDTLKERLDAMDQSTKEQIGGLSIGGTNLFATTKLYNGYINYKSGAVKYTPDDLATKLIPLNGYDAFVWTAYDTPFVAGSSTFKMYDADRAYLGSAENLVAGVNKITNTQAAYIAISFNVTQQGGISGSPRTWLETNHYKLELGNKQTDWSPAPDDVYHDQNIQKGTAFIANRGAKQLAPENSLPALRKVSNHSGVLINIHQTSDGVWVVMYDDTIDRMTNGTGAISSFKFANLRKNTISKGTLVGNYQADDLIIPSLTEALTIIKDKQLLPVIEIKKDDTDSYTDDSYDELVAIIQQFNIQDEVVITSKDHASLEGIKQRLPLVKVSYMVNGIEDNYIKGALDLGVNSGLNVNYMAGSLTADNVLKVHQAGLTVGAWTLDDDTRRVEMSGLGVDFITTNSQSGELRHQVLTLKNDWKNNENTTGFISEIAPGEICLNFLITSGKRDKGTYIAPLPDWATPTTDVWGQAMVRVNESGEPVRIGSVDITKLSTINVGLNWGVGSSTSASDWVSANVVYHV